MLGNGEDNGVYAVPKGEHDGVIKAESLYKYCKEQGKKPSDLKEEELSNYIEYEKGTESLLKVTKWLGIDGNVACTEYTKSVSGLISVYIKGIQDILLGKEYGTKEEFIQELDKITEESDLSIQYVIVWVKSKFVQELTSAMLLGVNLNTQINGKISLKELRIRNELKWEDKTLDSVITTIMTGVSSLTKEIKEFI